MDTQIILASSSKRRKDLLNNIGLDFKAISADIDECFDDLTSPSENVCRIAKLKAEKIFESHEDCIIIAADTTVVHDFVVFQKPKDEVDAFKMLNMLSGGTHEVITGICVMTKDKTVLRDIHTKVDFHEIDSKIIAKYIATKEPFDKCGGYGIQGIGGLFVKSIEGDFYNVVGLPLFTLFEILEKDFEIDIFKNM